MKYRLMMFSFIMVVFLLQGCLSQIASVEESAKTWISLPIIDRKDIVARPGYASDIGWQEKIYKLDNGNLVYVEPVRPDCFIHWGVNPEGIIIGYKTEGKRCW